MKFALVSQDAVHGARFWINPEEGDATSFFNWVDVWKGFHFNFEKLKTDLSVLRDFDCVMISGSPYNFQDIIDIGNYLKPTDTVTMFYPEGSVQLYDNSISNFSKIIYDAWNACDIVSIAEEDKVSYYEAFIRGDTIVRFIHVPLRREMEDGSFLVSVSHKARGTGLVYGDNNPNHPMIAVACYARLGYDVIGIDIDRGKIQQIRDMFPETRISSMTKLAQYPFLRILGRAFVHIYPTEWIGTARQQIACAVAGTLCIGNYDSHTQRRLFPEFGKDIYDVDGICGLVGRLEKDESFYGMIAERAFQEAIKFYGLEITKFRFMKSYHDALKIKQANRVHPVEADIHA